MLQDDAAPLVIEVAKGFITLVRGIEPRWRKAYLRFSDADLRGTSYKSAAFERCVFRNTDLDQVNFQGSTFAECRFEGDLREVLFFRTGFRGEAYPPNEMVDVDFSRARLHMVEFRGLALDRVRFPEDAEHVVVDGHYAVLDKLVAAFQPLTDPQSKMLAVYFDAMRKWTPKARARGVISLLDVAECAGPEAVKRVRELLPT